MDFGVAGGASTAGSSFRNFCSRTNVHLFTMIHVRQRKRSSSVSPPNKTLQPQPCLRFATARPG